MEQFYKSLIYGKLFHVEPEQGNLSKLKAALGCQFLVVLDPETRQTSSSKISIRLQSNIFLKL